MISLIHRYLPLFSSCIKLSEPHEWQKALKAEGISLDPMTQGILLETLYRLETAPHTLTAQDFEQILWPFAQKLLDYPHLRPVLLDRVKSSGKGIQGKLEVLALMAQHATQPAFQTSWDLFCEVEFLTSSLSDREPQVGWHLQLPNRASKIWKVDWSVCEGGSFVWILRNLEKPSEAIIACRGTASRSTATEGKQSVLNDLLPQMGGWGFASIWPQLKQWLIEQNIQQVDVMGKSLGGTYAQMITTALAHDTFIQVRSLHTLQGAGVDQKVHETFERTLAEKKFPEGLEITRWNVNLPSYPVDVVPFLGGFHLGQRPQSTSIEGLHVRNIYIGEKHPQQRISLWKIKQIFQLFLGLSQTHLLQARFLKLRPNLHIECLTGHQASLAFKPNLEPLRLGVAKIIRFLSWFFQKPLNMRFETHFPKPAFQSKLPFSLKTST